MTDSEYIKIYTGNTIVVQIIRQRLQDIGINPVIKDESESGRLAGFATSIPTFPKIYVHESETDKAVLIVESVKNEMEVSE